jgi:hypothetical protein
MGCHDRIVNSILAWMLALLYLNFGGTEGRMNSSYVWAETE